MGEHSLRVFKHVFVLYEFALTNYLIFRSRLPVQPRQVRTQSILVWTIWTGSQVSPRKNYCIIPVSATTSILCGLLLGVLYHRHLDHLIYPKRASPPTGSLPAICVRGHGVTIGILFLWTALLVNHYISRSIRILSLFLYP